MAIIKGDVAVILGHMHKGSLPVKAGDQVKTGEVIGKGENSGMADQPHLHIQAMKVAEGSFWTWEGVPRSFLTERIRSRTAYFLSDLSILFLNSPLSPKNLWISSLSPPLKAFSGQSRRGGGHTGPMRTSFIVLP